MSRTVYEERGEINGTASIEPFVEAILPLLQIYGVSGTRQRLSVKKDDDGKEINRCEIFSNQQGARLECGFYYDMTGMHPVMRARRVGRIAASDFSDFKFQGGEDAEAIR